MKQHHHLLFFRSVFPIMTKVSRLGHLGRNVRTNTYNTFQQRRGSQPRKAISTLVVSKAISGSNLTRNRSPEDFIGKQLPRGGTTLKRGFEEVCFGERLQEQKVTLKKKNLRGWRNSWEVFFNLLVQKSVASGT